MLEPEFNDKSKYKQRSVCFFAMHKLLCFG